METAQAMPLTKSLTKRISSLNLSLFAGSGMRIPMRLIETCCCPSTLSEPRELLVPAGGAAAAAGVPAGPALGPVPVVLGKTGNVVPCRRSWADCCCCCCSEQDLWPYLIPFDEFVAVLQLLRHHDGLELKHVDA